jgi:hypothetical protein
LVNIYDVDQVIVAFVEGIPESKRATEPLFFAQVSLALPKTWVMIFYNGFQASH